MSLTSKVKQQLKAKAHKLKPVVFIGNKGVTPGVIKEIDITLNDHELIKIRLSIQDRDTKKAAVVEICETLKAESIQLIGNICVLYRKSVTSQKVRADFL
jgi:RNA-binding protein